MVKLSAYIFCILLFCLALFQVLLISGMPFGNYAWGGQNEILPIGLRIGSVTSLIIYAFFAAVVLQKANIYSSFRNTKIANVGIWVIFCYSCIGILANAASRSKHERMVMTPIVIIMTITSLIIARNKASS